MTNAQSAALTEIEDGARMAGRSIETRFHGSALVVTGYEDGAYVIERAGDVRFVPGWSINPTPSKEHTMSDTLTITPAITPATAAADEALRVEHGVRVKRDGNGKVRGYDVRGEHFAKRADAIEKAAYWVAYEADTAAAIDTLKAAERKPRRSRRGDPVLGVDAILDAAAQAAKVDAAIEDEKAKVERKERKRTARRAAAVPSQMPRRLSKKELRGTRDEIIARGLASLSEAGAEVTIARMMRVTGLTASTVRRGLRAARAAA